ncbi:MAG TPA: HAD hydrolase family protein [Actinoplanes sp.]|nr:HAD hydrolase family protein [Actinoplanes sp.]
MIRYAALDLDGTLIDDAGRPFNQVVDGLRALRARSVVCLLVTGRSARSFRNLRHLDELLEHVDDQVLLSDGNVQLDRDGGRLSFPRVCPLGVLQRLVSELGIQLVAEWSGGFHATSARAALQFSLAYEVPRRQIEPLAVASANPAELTAITVFESRTPVAELLAGQDCDVTGIRPFGAQVVRPRGTGKAAALAEHLRRRFGEPGLDRTLAVGDGAADADMLRACAVGAATRDAEPAAVEAATVHLRGDLASFLRGFAPERW